MKRKPKRHCWECRRRCLVCDFTEPACRRCSASGVECPGYGDAKPMRLKWLAPGKVPSRGRQKASTQCWIVPRLDSGLKLGELFEGAEYYNSCIHVEMLPMHELGHNPHLYPVSAALIRVGAGAPDYLQLGMVCMVLGHRLNRLRSQPESRVLAEKFYRYWGLAVRSLNEQLNSEDTRGGDMVIAGMLTLLLADIHNGTSLNWRCHLDAVYTLIMLRGGLDAVAKSKRLYPVLLSFWSIAVFGNTTSPATDLSHTAAHLDALPFLLQQYGDSVGPFQFCPLPLFAELIRINHLRAVAATTALSLSLLADQHYLLGSETDSFSHAAWSILTRIEHNFSPSDWAAHKSSMPNSLHPTSPAPGGDVHTCDSRQHWLLIGRTYQAATALYCILSLHYLSLFARPGSPAAMDTATLTVQLDLDLHLQTRCALHARDLRALLAEGLDSPRMKRFLIWPLVVLGVCAHPMHGFLSSFNPSNQGGGGGGDQEKRKEDGLQEWVVTALRELSCHAGSCVPLTAKSVLARYWSVEVPGAEGWDRCFDRPFVFTGQVAVDTKALYGL